ncbi:MAG: zinc-dependent peptidase [Anaerohalosphaeraceae bacterium]|jgi:Mlc titration factor MtfA (ptsG expression regulator)
MTGIHITIGVVGVIALLILWKVIQNHLRNKRRGVLMRKPIDKGFPAFIEKNIPLYLRLPADLKQQLHGMVNVFLAEKEFVGCSGQEITDEVRVTIAAQACMLLLNRKTNFFPKLKTIYVYPHTYVANGLMNDGGLIVEGKSVRLGESWQNGPVVLTWDSITGGARNIQDGRNVVFHEFAHQLDQEDGDADGAPILENRSCYRSWAAVLSAEYERLCNKTRGRRRSVLNKYGATNPAEFFAVATEAFFEKPKQMNKKSPDLYKELKSYYQIDPMSWDTSN